MIDDLDVLEQELGPRLRRTLHAVAGAADVTEAPRAARRRWQRVAGLALAGAVAIGGVAAWMAQNPDAIVRLPVKDALMSGDGPSGEWWLLPTESVVDTCTPNPGVVLVAGEINWPGNELNAGGVSYGEPPHSNRACVPFDEAAWLEDPSRSDFGFMRLGYEHTDTPWGGYGTVHPTVTAVRISSENTAPLTIATVARKDRPDGPRFVAFSLPADTKRVSVELLDSSGLVIPGGDVVTTLSR